MYTNSKIKQSPQRTAILGLWWTWNYGAALTSYALYKIVEQLGYSPILFDHAHMSETWEKCTAKNTVFRKFIKSENILTLPIPTAKQANKAASNFLNFIVGSDQIWRYQYTHEFGTQFFLDFAKPGQRKIAYATSLGVEGQEIPFDFVQIATPLLEHFDAISVREFSGIGELDRLFGVQCTQTLDPVFLPGAAFWQKVAKSCTPEYTNKPYNLFYILDKNDSEQSLLSSIPQKTQEQSVLVTDYENPQSAVEAPQFEVIRNQISPYEWLAAIANCKFMLTDSFHGACFAIIFNKPFLCLINERRGATRFHTLQKLFPTLAHRFVNTSSPLDANLFEQDYAEVNRTMEARREQSLSWLQQALQLPPKAHSATASIPPCKKPGKLRQALFQLKQRLLSK